VTTSLKLWLPGAWTSTNEAIKLARAEAVYLAKTGRLPTGDNYAARAKAARERAAAVCRLEMRRLARPAERLRLRFVLLGHERLDPSAWYLSAKWIEDGLVDAGLVRSDRFDVYSTAGRVVPASEADAERAKRGTPGLKGMLVEIEGAP
jgi:hypothetical protein